MKHNNQALICVFSWDLLREASASNGTRETGKIGHQWYLLNIFSNNEQADTLSVLTPNCSHYNYKAAQSIFLHQQWIKWRQVVSKVFALSNPNPAGLRGYWKHVRMIQLVVLFLWLTTSVFYVYFQCSDLIGPLHSMCSAPNGKQTKLMTIW